MVLKIIKLADCILIKKYILFCVSTLFLFQNIKAQTPRPNLIVTTDIGQDPDDKQSMVRLLHYANEFNLLSIIANSDNNHKNESATLKDSVIYNLIDKYQLIEANLKQHDSLYPTANYLRGIVKKGSYSNGVDVPVSQYIGSGHDTEGSRYIVEAVENAIPPVNVAIWGGGCDLAQALWQARNTKTKAELEAFISKLRVYFINKQDSSNDWILENFPNLWVVLGLHASGNSWESGYRGMFLGGDLALTNRQWLQTFVKGENELANQYPEKTYTGGEQKNPNNAIKEGDTPSWFFFLDNGLNFSEHPEWGGWGGRYTSDTLNLYTDAKDAYFDVNIDSMVVNERASVFRWRADFQNDFANRILWGIKKFDDANHYPKTIVNNSSGEEVLYLECKPKDRISLDASKSFDIDGNSLKFEWFVYNEAGTYSLTANSVLSSRKGAKILATIPEDAGNTTIHVILKVKDDGDIPLVSYRRIILKIK